MTVRVCAADQDAVFFDDAEARCCFAGAGQRAVPAMGAQGLDEGVAPGGGS